MKNIHVLPTDKPSRLFEILQFNFIFDNQNKYSEEYKKLHSYKSKNIYITSDEELVLGGYHFNSKYGDEPQKTNQRDIDSRKYWEEEDYYIKKIILTTDQDLIKDGVQAIDDEFLEWFVKHPSCEWVEVIITNEINVLVNYHKPYYKIIIPKEEPKFENSIDNTMNIMSIANSMFGKKEEHKQELSQLGTKEFNDLASVYFGGKPKQETLEEFIQRQLSLGKYQDQESAIRHSIELGVKWQKEQAKEMEEQQKDDYAVEFAEWYMRKYTGLSYFKISDNELEQFKNK